jgi:predicted transport protein
MPLFRISDGKFQQLKPWLAAKEKHLQQLVETNLLECLDIHLLETEYSTTSGGRIDTLGVDRNGAPVIIEYKRNQNDNVINQALSYLRWLTAQKSEFFEMLMTRRLSKDVLEIMELDWKHPRIICIAENFNKFDIDTVEVLPMRIELMTYRFYENDVFSLEAIQLSRQRQADLPASSFKTVNTEPDLAIADYSVDAHRSHGSDEIRAVFDDLRDRILALPQVVERAAKVYIGYRATKNFAEITVQKSQLKISLRPIDYDDPGGKVIKVPDSYRWTLDRQISVNSANDLDSAMNLIQQSYNDVA